MTQSAPTKTITSQPSRRLLSLDVARGLTIILMIIVNNPGTWDHIYAPLEHAKWHGFTPTDFVFPSFLFIVGVSIAFALSRRKADGASHAGIMIKVAKRGAILFLIGLLISASGNNFDLSHLRIPGVLQRIALVFVIGSFMFLKMSPKAMAVTAFSLLAGYYVLMNFVPVPGFGPSNLDPETNLGAWLDRLVFGVNHLWSGTKTWDPEGLLSSVPAIATGLFGILAGLALMREEPAADKLRRFVGVGGAFVVAGILFNFAFPINKGLWTSSYVLLTSGLSLFLVGGLWWLIDVKGSKAWTGFFVLFGTNSILAYILSEMFQTIMMKIPKGADNNLWDWLFQTLYLPLFNDPRAGSLLWALTVLALFTPIMLVMHRRGWILKV